MSLHFSELCAEVPLEHASSSLEAYQKFQSFFPLKILEPQDFEGLCFALCYLFLTGFVQKSAVHKLFITHPIHDFTFPLNFYEGFLC